MTPAPGSRDALLHDDRLTYSVPEVGVMLNLGRSAAYRAVRLGQIRTLQLSGRKFVTRTTLLDLLGLSENSLPPGNPHAHAPTSRATEGQIPVVPDA